MRYLFLSVSMIFLFASCEQPPSMEEVKTAVMEEMDAAMTTQHEAMSQKMDQVVEAWNSGNAKLPEVVADNVVRTTNGVEESADKAAYEANMKNFISAFPDFNVTMDKFTIKDGTSYIYWTVTGTNTGPFMENPPTNNPMEVHGFSVWQTNDDGKFVREDAYFDNMAMMSQLGYSVSPPE
ncbi:MAG: SnoaL-like domain-containing protein [Chitinophagales bacterium]|nr:SnoaL-like domain-containing protein [Chitinophagales bacterium]